MHSLMSSDSIGVVSTATRPRLVIVNEILSDKALVKAIMTDVDWLL